MIWSIASNWERVPEISSALAVVSTEIVTEAGSSSPSFGSSSALSAGALAAGLSGAVAGVLGSSFGAGKTFVAPPGLFSASGTGWSNFSPAAPSGVVGLGSSLDIMTFSPYNCE